MTRDQEVKLAEVQHRHRSWEEAGMRITQAHLDKAFLLKLVRAHAHAFKLLEAQLTLEQKVLCAKLFSEYAT